VAGGGGRRRRRPGGGREEAARRPGGGQDTESKTRTPHKDVGKNIDFEVTKCENWRKSRTQCSF